MKNNSDITEISDEEEILLGLFYGLELLPKDPKTGETIINEQTRLKPTKTGISQLKAIKEKIKDCSIVLATLAEKKFISLEGEIYSLTSSGRVLGKSIRSKQVSEYFDEILIRSANSEAHSLFCEKVFGKNLYQFNVLDMAQLDSMMSALSLKTSDYVLDVGCGLGKVAEYIANETGAKILGIDFAKKVIDWAKEHTRSSNANLEFQVMNINELDFPPSTFNAIIAIDTLYPWNVENLDETIAKLKEFLKPNGQMGIFAAQFRNQDEPIELLHPDKTKMAVTFIKNGLSYDSIDFTENAKALWHREISAATELKTRFEKEGNLDLCEARLADAKQVLQRMNSNQQCRYFYHVKLNNDC